MLFKIPIKIDDPEEIDWAYFWEKKVEAKDDIKKDWDKEASRFGKYAVCGGYNNELLSKLKLDKEDTVLDLGCGEGSITIPISKQVKSVTGVDLSENMLELLNENAQKEGYDIFISGDIPHHGRREVVLRKYNYLDLPHEIEKIFMPQMEETLLSIDPTLEIVKVDHEELPILIK